MSERLSINSSYPAQSKKKTDKIVYAGNFIVARQEQWFKLDLSIAKRAIRLLARSFSLTTSLLQFVLDDDVRNIETSNNALLLTFHVSCFNKELTIRLVHHFMKV